MGASAGLMQATSTATSGISSMGTAYAQSQSIQAQGAYKQQVANQNAALATIQSQDALNRGEYSANQSNIKTKQLIGQQRADMAAQGVDVNSGSAADVQSSTSAIGALDALTIRNNAYRESFGYKVQSLNDTYSGQFAADSANTQATNTLLTGGMNAVSSGLKSGSQFAKLGNNSSGTYISNNNFDFGGD